MLTAERTALAADLVCLWPQAEQVAELSRTSDAQLLGQLWADAAGPPPQQPLLPQLPQVPQLPRQQPQQQQPNAFARQSGPAAYHPSMLADMSFGSGW